MTQPITKPIQVAFVGCGEISHYYLPVYRDLPFVRVAACIDSDEGLAQKAASLVPTHAPKISTRFEEALGSGIDAVVINTPNFMHRPHAVVAIEADKHVLLQKPLATTVADARAIAAAAAASRRVCALYMSYFDQPLFYDLRDLIQQGRLGSIVHFYARLMHRHGMRWSNAAVAGRPTWRGSIEQTGGGCFIQLAVHYVHMIEWLADARVQRITGISKRLHCPGLEGEDIALALLELDNGASITLDTGWNAVGEEFSIHGTLGSVNYRNNRVLSLWSAKGDFSGRVVQYQSPVTEALDGPRGEERELILPPPAMGDTTNPLNQHRVFLEAVRDGKPPWVSIASGVHDMEVVAGFYESVRTGRVAAVSAP